MNSTRRYPDEPAGPFPVPPATITDREGRSLAIDRLPADESALEALTRMYCRFHPADRAQGIPPTGEAQINAWLEPLVERGVNVAVGPADPAAAESVRSDTAPGTSAADAEPGTTATEVDSEATDGTDYVGHAVLVPDTDDSEVFDAPGTYEWELAIFVLQDYQGAGVGTALLSHLLGEAARLGIERVWLTVERWNSAAISLYEKLGFETVGTERFDVEMAIRLDDD